ncbi:hypothetical protein [Achromobacter sp. UMC71]|uniref:hypothetical protein n=1 Tax=Achromobacter sp. UMC71 TaxID=1862320 RepID=UPI00351C5A8B|nr:hypothetical protein [Achromobacter sp. UMC71]
MKKTTASTPQDLAGATAAYYQRLAALAQESQQRWLALGQRLANDNANQTLSSLEPLKADGNWQQVAPALSEAARKQWQRQLEAGQAVTHAALEDQAALAAGLSEAVSDWLRSTSAVAGGGLAASPLTRMWTTFSEQMTSACTAMQEASQPGARHGR